MDDDAIKISFTHLLAACIFVMALSAPNTHAIDLQTDNTDLFEMSIQDLMSITVNVASNQQRSMQQQPSTVTVITENQISRSGARYLIDLIKQVPGFWVGADTIGTFSVSFRGVWGMEAKILLIIDGIEQNELAFGSLVLGNRYPVSTMKQVEIIRGPGSVKYGNQAGLAVIKVTSKGDDIAQQQIAVTSDSNAHGIYNNTYSVISAGQISAHNNLHYSALFSAGQGDYSDQTWHALDGYQYNLSNTSNAQPMNANLSMSTDNIQLRFMYDKFSQQDRLLFGDSGLFVSPNERYTQNNTLSFESSAFSASHDLKINDNLSINSKVTHVQQAPWNMDAQYNQKLQRNAQRSRIDLVAQYKMNNTSNIAVGTSYYQESESISESYLFNAQTRFDGKNNIKQTDKAIYTQLETDTDLANFTLGGRYEDHDAIGGHFAPRFAAVRTFGHWHSKLVFNQAYKTPQFDTIASAENAGTPIQHTELSTTVELELGYLKQKNTQITNNLFWLDVKNYIGFNPITASNATLGDFSAYGDELEIRYTGDRIIFSASYSLFLIDQNSVSAIEVEADNNAVLGIPNHMFKMNGHYQLNHANSLNTNGTLISNRYACVNDLALVCGKPNKLPIEYDISIFYRHQHKNLSYNLGVANLFDSPVNFAQPYRGSQSPIPGLKRRAMLDIGYTF